MGRTVDALIPERGSNGGTRVDHRADDLTAQLEALHPQCFGWAMACCGNQREDAEDVLQDTYVSVLGGLQFNGASSLRTWLFGIIRHKARERGRREWLRALLSVRSSERIDRPAPAPAPDDDAVATDRREHTRRALSHLPRRQREVLMLVFYHDLTVDHAAEVMGVSVGSARVHYARGKQRMATLLSDTLSEPRP